MSDLRILTVGETDDVWMTTTSNIDLTTATAQVRTFTADQDPTGVWGTPQDVLHPDDNTIKVAMRVADAVEGSYVMQVKLEVGALVIIESGYYWVTQL